MLTASRKKNAVLKTVGPQKETPLKKDNRPRKNMEPPKNMLADPQKKNAGAQTIGPQEVTPLKKEIVDRPQKYVEPGNKNCDRS
eukprot:15478268-Alexandrium_andersonii.AAC.1